MDWSKRNNWSVVVFIFLSICTLSPSWIDSSSLLERKIIIVKCYFDFQIAPTSFARMHIATDRSCGKRPINTCTGIILLIFIFAWYFVAWNATVWLWKIWFKWAERILAKCRLHFELIMGSIVLEMALQTESGLCSCCEINRTI